MERADLSQLLRAGRGVAPQGEAQKPCLVKEADPVKFMASFADAVAGDANVFLTDPRWGAAEMKQLQAMLASAGEKPESRNGQGWLMIPTGGSSGNLKFARHDQGTIAAAVGGFTQHFGLKHVNAVGLLPLFHVSGFMAWMRCMLTGGEYLGWDWKKVEHGEFPVMPVKPDGWVISLVPTQLARLLEQPSAKVWLAGFRTVFLGGAPAAAELLDGAAKAGIRLSLGYGMTETAAMVTALRPEDFLAGGRTSGGAMPHAKVSLAADGTIQVTGRSVSRGYFPDWHDSQVVVTGDLGQFDGSGRLTVLGRKDRLVISGGEKIQPEEVEAALLRTGQFEEVLVVGIPDAEWGQIVVAAYPDSRRPDMAKVHHAMVTQLAPAKRPKRWMPLADWPRNEAGKVDRSEVRRRVAGQA